MSVEQCIQNLTLTATPKVIQREAPTQVLQNKILPQVHPNKPPANTFNKTNKGNSGKPVPEQQQQQTNRTQACQLCGNEDHNAGFCSQFTSPQEKRAELMRQKRCNRCAAKFTSNHQCNPRIWCKHCQGNHRTWLCTEKKLGEN